MGDGTGHLHLTFFKRHKHMKQTMLEVRENGSVKELGKSDFYSITILEQHDVGISMHCSEYQRVWFFQGH